MDTTEPFLCISYNINSFVTITSLQGNSIGLLLLGLFFLLLLSIVSGGEDAIFAIIPNKLKELKKYTDTRNTILVKLLESPQVLKASILILKNILYIVIFICLSFALNSFIIIEHYSAGIFLLQLALIIAFIFLFRDLVVKVIVPGNHFQFARIIAPPFNIIHKVLYPLSNYLMNSTSVISKKLLKRRQFTLEELSDALNLSSNEIREDKNILQGIIKFGNINAKEIMKSRIDVDAADINTEFEKLMDIIIDSGHTRIPVYEESFDNVKGILYTKDLLPYLNNREEFEWQKLIRPPYFVPETKKINGLLKEFQNNKIHMAIVIDEYGGTYGIVTLEDILEEIVGEIADESDTDEMYYSKIDNNTFIFEGKTLLNDFYKILNLNDDFFKEIKGDADTIAGIILEMKGEIPRKNEMIKFKNLTFKIESSDKRRIKKIKVIIE
ncbi:MAG: gliding motility-associated protein GldE [Bacteroidales bacterium]|nr:gliding motility-associated protein GldE [Bacteroidales bacterium]